MCEREVPPDQSPFGDRMGSLPPLSLIKSSIIEIMNIMIGNCSSVIDYDVPHHTIEEHIVNEQVFLESERQMELYPPDEYGPFCDEEDALPW